jgi:hypothetical protein
MAAAVPVASAPVIATVAPALPAASASIEPTSPRTAATRPLPTDARPVPPIVSAASAPAGASATNTAALAASSAARTRQGRPVPLREDEPATGPYASPSVDNDTRQRAAQAVREPNVAARPVPTFTPSGPRTATEVCGRRVFLALAICMDRECERPLFRDQPDCKKVIETKRQRENQ